ncbi:MAG: FAD-dependent monooxygenase, partial [Candidatus Obscuribacterales bacterium]|nr:FAD-dependent monooxygenase [Steroidobacteraceae bacterium]
MAIFLSQRGYRVTALERLPDVRRTPGIGGRSINLALADRGIHALRAAGVFESIEPLLVPMRGRMLHDLQGEQTFLAYGQNDREVIYSISRAHLSQALLDHAERVCDVELRFRQTGISVDASANTLWVQDLPTGKLYTLPLHHLIGADGAGSVLRRFFVESAGAHCSESLLTHGYKELSIAANADGAHQLAPHALHVWPRGEFMLIALPNIDGTFTATLFLPLDGRLSFSALAKAQQVEEFFRAQFNDVLALIPNLTQQFFAHPTGTMGTVRCDRWMLDDRVVLIGDAAHAIVPFHGQGMNCALEDCVELNTLLADDADWASACVAFQRQRKPNTNAIADMALENYVEMRDTVRDPKFQLQKALSLELERLHPTRFIPRYSMVMFHHEIPYATAFERGRNQDEILQELARNADSLTAIDFSKA